MNFIKFLAEANDISNFKINDVDKDYVIFMIAPNQTNFEDEREDAYGFINHIKVVEYAVYYTFNGNDYVIGIKTPLNVEINDNEEEILHDKNRYTSQIIDAVMDSMLKGNHICERQEDGGNIELRKSQLENILAMISHNKQFLIQKSAIDFNLDKVQLIHDDNG